MVVWTYKPKLRNTHKAMCVSILFNKHYFPPTWHEEFIREGVGRQVPPAEFGNIRDVADGADQLA